MKIFYLLALALLYHGVQGFAQNPSYLHYGLSDGLPSNLVYHATQDSLGFMWFGTDKGLARFDGERFRVFTMRDGLPDPEVLRVKEDRKGRVWLSCFGQNPCYYQRGCFYTEKLDTVLAAFGAPKNTHFFEDPLDSSMWFSNYRFQLFQLKGKKLKVWHVSQLENLQMIARIGEGPLLGFASHGLVEIHPNGTTSNVVRFPTQGPKTLTAVATVGTRILVAFSRELLLLEYQNGQLRLLQKADWQAENVMSDSKGRFWACVPGQGAVCLGIAGADFNHPVWYLPKKRVLSCFEDRQGTFWFNTQDEGVYALPVRHIAHWNSTVTGAPIWNITALAAAHNGSILAGNDHGQLFWVSKEGLREAREFALNNIQSRIRQLLPMPDGSLWVVSDRSFWHLRPNAHPQQYEGPQYGAPKYLTENQGRIWLSSSSMAGYLTPPPNGPSVVKVLSGRTTTVCRDGESLVWAGSLKGMYNLSDGTGQNQAARFPLLNSRIMDIKAAGKQRLWVSTTEHGLLEVQTKDGHVAAVRPVFAESVDNISAIIPAPDRNIYLATNHGIVFFNHDLPAGYPPFSRIDTRHGLPDDEIKALLWQKDTIWAATYGHLSFFEKRTTRTDNGHFPTFLTAYRYSVGADVRQFPVGDSLSMDDKERIFSVEVPPGAGLLELDFTGLDFRRRGDLRYELVAQEVLLPLTHLTWGNLFHIARHSWSSRPHTDTILVEDNVRRYGASMERGRWRIQVTACTSDEVRSEMPQDILLTVWPRWYEIIWFWLAGVSLIVVGVWYAFRSQRILHENLMENAKLQLVAVKARINPHFIGNGIHATQQFFFPPDPGKASRYISLFSALVRRTMQYSEQNFISFEEELAYQRDFLEMVRIRLGERFQYEITGTEQVDAKQAFPALLVQPIVENATVHGLATSGISQLSIRYQIIGRRLVCTVTDNGMGINASRTQKKRLSFNRVSNGIRFFEETAHSLNKLHNIRLTYTIQDIADLHQGAGHGTQATISFDLNNVPNVQK